MGSRDQGRARTRAKPVTVRDHRGLQDQAKHQLCGREKRKDAAPTRERMCTDKEHDSRMRCDRDPSCSQQRTEGGETETKERMWDVAAFSASAAVMRAKRFGLNRGSCETGGGQVERQADRQRAAGRQKTRDKQMARTGMEAVTTAEAALQRACTGVRYLADAAGYCTTTARCGSEVGGRWKRRKGVKIVQVRTTVQVQICKEWRNESSPKSPKEKQKRDFGMPRWRETEHLAFVQVRRELGCRNKSRNRNKNRKQRNRETEKQTGSKIKEEKAGVEKESCGDLRRLKGITTGLAWWMQTGEGRFSEARLDQAMR